MFYSCFCIWACLFYDKSENLYRRGRFLSKKSRAFIPALPSRGFATCLATPHKDKSSNQSLTQKKSKVGKSKVKKSKRRKCTIHKILKYKVLIIK